MNCKTCEELRAELDRVMREMDEARADANENAKELNRLEDWLIGNAQFDFKTGLIDRVAKLKDRIRDLVAAEGELAEAKAELDRLKRQNAVMREANQKAYHALRWSRPHAGSTCDGEYVTKSKAMQFHAEACAVLYSCLADPTDSDPPTREEVDKEIREFQESVRDLVIEMSGAPSESIDGKGSDAGWQEFTLAEIRQGFAWMSEHRLTPEQVMPLVKTLNEIYESYSKYGWEHTPALVLSRQGVAYARSLGLEVTV